MRAAFHKWETPMPSESDLVNDLIQIDCAELCMPLAVRPWAKAV